MIIKYNPSFLTPYDKPYTLRINSQSGINNIQHHVPYALQIMQILTATDHLVIFYSHLIVRSFYV